MVAWRAFGAALVGIVCLVTGPAAYAQDPGVPATAPQILPPDSVESRIEALIAAPSQATTRAKLQGDADDLNAAKAFYAARVYAPLWVTPAGLNAKAGLVLAEIAKADDWGLRSGDFTLPALKPGASAPSRDALAEAEIAMTRAVLKYARYARGGRIADPSGQLSEYLDRKPQFLAPQAVLEQLAATVAPDATLRGFHPQHVQFERLRQAYLKARAEQGRSAALRLPEGPMLSPGQSHPSVAILRKRLGVPVPRDAADPASAEQVYDPALVEAVRAFQVQTSMRRADGIVGEKTRSALNGETDGKIPALLANMEQWRWMPSTLGASYVQVNIPEFEMRLIQDGRVVHSERVVTGKVETATPIFSGELQTVVFQPKWGVPDSIKINELLPRLQDGRGLRSGLRMALNGREIDPWSVNWNRADITRYHIYQPSGDDNALGVVKFLFPNKHAVYLHDTPSKNLFNAATRSYSHGCVRLRNPVRLAELVLASDKGWDAQLVQDLVESGPEDNAIKLDSKIPVHITYFTASVDDAGKVSTFPDVYGHERRVTQVLTGHADQIAKLNPPPLGAGRAVASGDADGYGTQRRRATDSARFAPPAALGYVATPPPPLAKLFSFTPSPPAQRSRGSTPNDLIMRQLGGGF